MATEAPVNGVQTTLASPYITSTGQLTFNLTSNAGFTNAQYHVLVTDGTNYEIMLVSGQVSSVLTVTRAVESYGGVQTAYTFGAGSTVTVIPSVASVQALIKQNGDTSSVSFTRASGFPTYGGGTAVETLAITTAAVGDVVLLVIHTLVQASLTASPNVFGLIPLAITDTNNRITWDTAPLAFYASPGDGANLSMWKGVVTSVGTTTVTDYYSGSVATTTTRMVCDEWTPSSGSLYRIGVGTDSLPCVGVLDLSSNSAHTTVNFPTLIAPPRGGLYWAYDFIGVTGSAGSTPGYSYTVTTGSNLLVANGSITPGTTCSPTATQTSGEEGGLAIILVAY